MTQTEHVRQIIADYLRVHHVAVYQPQAVAAWAVNRRLWSERPDAAIDRCADAISRASREETLPGGVRAKHAITVIRNDVQLTFWADIRCASREHMTLAFEQRRAQIAADCRRLKRDVDYYNTHHNAGPSLQFSFTFD